ncbi:MFS transporter [Qipengyuania aquimaris]|uniref:MFS transporter n=1 Tax=Qipengyuania aquimaris TaxID=255984 RepID=A0A9Q3RZM7_9SPHN|nr:MFS transporter [Qipengyuania aquimaris]MBY6217393.1 MFS transporter [Qipengyuania aquimaris]
MATTAGVQDKPTVWLKLAHGSGAAAFGIKNNGFDYFLLLFYGTVIGLEPGLVGLAIFIALTFDAVSDPLVGYWSDNFRSKWGRRHPFMYAAALPVALSYFMLWNPPELGQTGLFFYLTGLAVLIRTFITFYETPSSALIPELTSDYEERTSLQSYRLFFGWTGGTMMSIIMFGALMTGPLGMLDPQAYATYGVVGSLMILVTILISAIGTHHRIPHLHRPVATGERYTVRRIFREMFETLSEKSFIALFFATVLFAIASGLAAALSFLMLRYFWGFAEFQIFIWTCTVVLSALMGFLIAPWSVRKIGKKQSVVVLGVLAFTIQPAPVLLRLLGMMPENGDPLLFPLVLGINVIDLALIIATQAVAYSMIADLVESNQVKTGRRNEGVYYAATTFTRKVTQGIGVAAAGAILSMIAFPEGAEPEAVPAETLWKLGAFYAPSLLVLYLGALYCISRYRIDKAGHEENLRKLAESRGPQA